MYNISKFFKKETIISWYWLSRNPNAIDLIEQNLDKIDWDGLSRNPNAIHILEQNLGLKLFIHISTNLTMTNVTT